MEANLATAKQLGLNEEEYNNICETLGRTPNFTELSIYSVMWSEHCSYKNSIKYLKTLPKKGEHLLVEAGEENAGLVDIGNGLACAFKIESHNHPSAIEPYQGAATGVGGIHRDIFTMGARPIAALNSLRFGMPDTPRTKHLIKGVVKGIGDYGNCLGVPTVGGEVYFDPSYEQNILVNAMSVGVVKVGETVSAIAEGIGNPVFIVGSATGKDGIHGATFASADLTEDSADDLPAVQVGDPFQEKMLLEASLEAIQTGALVGMQDMGAAGISCSTSEMSAKGEVGMRINLDLVPTRQSDMKPFEILLSESQERMLIVCHKDKKDALLAVFEKWDLTCVEIGEVTEGGQLEFFANGACVANVPAEHLVLGGGAPVYSRDFRPPSYLAKIAAFDPKDVAESEDIVADAQRVFSHPNVLSKRWIYEQYDGTVRTNSISENKKSDAAVIRLKQSQKGIAMTTDCNGAYVFADPRKGAQIAVAEAARNIVSTGAKPMAITNCLNFGNPYNEEVYWQFVQAIQGMGEACLKFETPVTGGNVSFYNHTVLDDKAVPVFPTPTIGMIGLLENANHSMGMSFQRPADRIFLIGDHREDLNSSIYLRSVHGVEYSPSPHVDLDDELQMQNAVLQLIQAGLVTSVHDLSDGGLFVSIMECAMPMNLSFDIKLPEGMRLDANLFGEGQGRYLISCSEDQISNLVNNLDSLGVKYHSLGTVEDGNKDILINGINFGPTSRWASIYNNTLGNIIES